MSQRTILPATGAARLLRGLAAAALLATLLLAAMPAHDAPSAMGPVPVRLERDAGMLRVVAPAADHGSERACRLNCSAR